ncbi:hypothetical protein CHS0354_042258 [Potamilus streckersoni]|uniref:ADAM10 endopeptidase n=1 Tax=Potamilus streckersoni TaxID=2493646 RepID=A0AAE0W2D1_9BIVA|nr:hypothetical protein CHS0354_042258 [Potamilus streckersoni]
MPQFSLIRKYLVFSMLAMDLKVCLGGSNLDDYILHYEELSYDSADLHQRHLRSKRSTDGIVHLDFDAFGRNFKLRLHRDTSVFTPSYMMREEDGTLKDVDLSFLYTGEVMDSPGSKVDGAIIQGMFRGEIHIPGDTVYHIEVNNRFNKSQLSAGHHSVIYRDKDLNLDPYRSQREREKREASRTASKSGYCGNDQAVQWMRSVVQSEDTQDKTRQIRGAMEWQEVYDAHNSQNAEHNIYSSTSHRQKRGILTKENTCTLHLRSDPLLWKHVNEKTHNEDITRDEILAFFARHVKALNDVYTLTNFTDGNVWYFGIRFAVQRTTVMTWESAKCDNQLSKSPYCDDNLDVSNFLNLLSLENHNAFCLAYVFTYRDFAQGTLGLAWVGAPSQASGGVCEKFKQYSGVWKSLNTGIVTTLNYGKEVPFSVSKLTFAHEVGHNFGSPHDSGATCAPAGDQGNYIMFPSATTGDRENNNKFSPCSKGNISRVLDAVINQRSGKVSCFADSLEAFCGNGLKEEGEECDCGYAEDCKDRCCNGMTDGLHTKLSCKRKDNTICSPSEGACCTDNCVHANETFTCREKEECQSASNFTSNSSVCPPSTQVPNGVYCSNYGYTCKNGECAGSLCERFGWHECFVTGATGSVAEKEKLCILACFNNATNTCIPSNDPDLNDISPPFYKMVKEVVGNRSEGGIITEGVKLAAGSPCNNFQGYCDVFHRCRGIDAEGPLSRLTNLIFDPKTLESVRDWIIEHWWAVLLMALGLVLAMGLFVKFFAVYTPSSIPKAMPERRLSDRIRRRPNQIHQQQQHYGEKKF